MASLFDQTTRPKRRPDNESDQKILKPKNFGQKPNFFRGTDFRWFRISRIFVFQFEKMKNDSLKTVRPSNYWNVLSRSINKDEEITLTRSALGLIELQSRANKSSNPIGWWQSRHESINNLRSAVHYENMVTLIV